MKNLKGIANKWIIRIVSNLKYTIYNYVNFIARNVKSEITLKINKDAQCWIS